MAWELTTNVGTPLEGVSAPTPPPPAAEPTTTMETTPTPEPDPLEAEASAEPTDDQRDPRGRFRGRHRAQSQQATPEDVETINALTKQLREAEAEAGIVRKPGESQRVFELRRRVEMAQALKTLKQPAPRPVSVTPAAVPQPPPAFTKAEPKIEDFAQSDDPYRDLMRAYAAYDREKADHERRTQDAQTQAQTQAQQLDAAFAQWIGERQKEHDTRLGAFFKANPDALPVIEAAGQIPITPLIHAAIELHERGPEFMLELARHPELADELALLTADKPVVDAQKRFNPLVASVQRRLLARVQAVSTGSAASRPVVLAPRPPNPVRTVPQTPASAMPGDDAPLSAHEKAFGPKRRR